MLTGMSLVAGATLAVGLPGNAQSIDSLHPVSNSSLQPASSLPDGTYLYGQSAKPDEIGQGYFVFEVNKGNVIGALYMPRSSFDCAFGRFQGNELALTVVNSYDRSTNPFAIAIDRNSTVATTENLVQQPISLQGFHPIDTISENDQRMLNVCKQDIQK
jgi:hypothetical protein